MMRTPLLLLLTLVFYAPLIAQKRDSSLFVGQSEINIDKLESPDQKADSLALIFKKRFKTIDSTGLKFEQRVNNLNPKNLSGVFTRSRIPNPQQNLTGFLQPGFHKLDSLNPQQKLQQYNQRLLVVQKHLTHRIDSLSKLQALGSRKAVDSLRRQLDSLKTAGPIKDIKKAEASLMRFESKINSGIGGVENKITGRLSGFTQNGGNVPGLNLPVFQFKLPTVGARLNACLDSFLVGRHCGRP